MNWRRWGRRNDCDGDDGREREIEGFIWREEVRRIVAGSAPLRRRDMKGWAIVGGGIDGSAIGCCRWRC